MDSETMNLFKTEKELAESGYIFRIVDNGGSSFDRVTVLFCDGDYLALSQTGHGFSQWGTEFGLVDTMAEWVESGECVDLAFGDLSPELRRHILGRVNEAWQDFLEAVTRGDESAVAKSRELAEPNDGTHDSAGKGLYAVGSGYAVRLDGDHAADDRGPFATAREALAATLPDDYSLSGPEYHSTVDVGSMRRTRDTAARLRKLERRRDQEHKREWAAERTRRDQIAEHRESV